MAVDKFDLAILKVLQGDARASLLDISKRVGLSATPCWNRIRKMEADGVIQGYTARIDPAAIGFTETVIVQVTLESHTDETLYDFGRTLEQIPEVLEAYLVSGDYDYYIRIAVKPRAITSACCASGCTGFPGSGTASRASCCGH